MQDTQLQPSIVHACHDRGIWLAWLNVRMGVDQFNMHQATKQSRSSMKELLYLFDLIMPEADTVSFSACIVCNQFP